MPQSPIPKRTLLSVDLLKVFIFSLVFVTGSLTGTNYAKSYNSHTATEPQRAPITTTHQDQSQSYNTYNAKPDIISQTEVPTPRVAGTYTSSTPPSTGKAIYADLVNMQLSLYSDGQVVDSMPIATRGKKGSPWDTPVGNYTIMTKEKNHFSSIGGVNMPYSMQFYGNYFIHGWPTYPDGTSVASTFSGGCIRLSTPNASKVFAFADYGTPLIVYDKVQSEDIKEMPILPSKTPTIDADAYIVADIGTLNVYAERNATTTFPVASITKLMSALVANETISFDTTIAIPRNQIINPPDDTDRSKERFAIGDLLYPLLMESNNNVAEIIGRHYGTSAFVKWMNTTAQAFNMSQTTFADTTGISDQNASTAEDLFRLAKYITDKKQFIWQISKTPQKTIKSISGGKFTFGNLNEFSGDESFIGGKAGQTTNAKQTMVSLFTVQSGREFHRIAIIVLHAKDSATATKQLSSWLASSITNANKQTACVTCAKIKPRKIQL